MPFDLATAAEAFALALGAVGVTQFFPRLLPGARHSHGVRRSPEIEMAAAMLADAIAERLALGRLRHTIEQHGEDLGALRDELEAARIEIRELRRRLDRHEASP